MSKNATEPSDSELKKEIETFEGRAESAAWLIVFGLVIEVVLAVVFREHKSLIETWAPVTATTLVLMGVYGEIHLGRKVSAGHTKLRTRGEQRLAEALTRAANAEEELIKFRTSRRKIFAVTSSIFVATVSKHKGTVFDTGLDAGGEAMHFAWDLDDALTKAGWIHIPWVDPSGLYKRQGHIISGQCSGNNIEIHIHPQSRAFLGPIAADLISALRVAGIEATDEGCNVHSTNANAIHVIIGPKA